jgi:hypothetical protein
MKMIIAEHFETNLREKVDNESNWINSKLIHDGNILNLM